MFRQVDFTTQGERRARPSTKTCDKFATIFYTMNMKNIREFKHKIDFVLTDIDDTLTDEGQLRPKAYESLWNLKSTGIHVVPVTGRPAGWCEMIARFWPVSGVIGENGGFYFCYKNQKMQRNFVLDSATQISNRKKLDQIQNEILNQVPGCAVASDQFSRLMDLAIDFCEDVPALNSTQVKKIVSIFEKHGAHAKVSSIHVNGWFGEYNKLTQTLAFLKNEFHMSPEEAKNRCVFVGDSPNDEPMWQYFPHGMAVANISSFLPDLQSKPAYVASGPGGDGFSEIAAQIIANI